METQNVKWAVEGVVKRALRRVIHDVQAYVSCRACDGTPLSARETRESGWYRGFSNSSLTKLSGFVRDFLYVPHTDSPLCKSHSLCTINKKQEDNPMKQYHEFAQYLREFPDQNGYFGPFGGAFLPPQLIPVFQEITDATIAINS